MNVYSFDNKLLGAADWSDHHLLLKDRSGREVRIRADAIYGVDGARLTLICYEETLSYWCVEE